MTSEEWAVVSRTVALQLAHERIFGTDRTLPIRIETVRAAKDTELERLVPSVAEGKIDGTRLAEETTRLIGEMALLSIALTFAQRNYAQMLKDKPGLYVALHGVLTFSRSFRAAVAETCAPDRTSHRAARGRACDAPYFFIRRKAQKYCGTDCRSIALKERNDAWWAKHGKRWRAERKKKQKKPLR